MSSRISFNVNAQRLGDSAYFMQVMKALRPASVTIMHGFELAQQLVDQTGTVAFFRTDVDKDPDLLALTPAEYVAHYKANKNGTARVHGYVLNEPVQTARFSWKSIVDWLTEVGYRLADAKLPAVIGNIGPGTFEKADVENGTFDRLLKMLNDTAEVGHSLGVHEYTGILLPFGVGQWSREMLLDKNAVQPAAWPPAAQLPRARWNGTLPPYWHLRRSDWLQIRAKEIGLKPVMIDMTEFGWDRLPDLTVGGQLNPYGVLQSRYGLVAPHRTYRGVASLRRVFEDYFPQRTFEQSVFEQLKWADQIYPPDVRALHVFTWSENAPDWDIEFGCNISRFKALHTLLVFYANNQPEQPTPQPEPEPKEPPTVNPKPHTLSIAGDAIKHVNIYGQKSSFNMPVLGTVPKGAMALVDMTVDPPLQDWLWVEYNGVKGYAPRMRGVVTWTLADSEPQPEPPTLPAADDPRWTAAHAAPRNSNVNIRPDPSTNQRAVGQLKSGDGITDVFTIPALKHIDPDGFTWHLIQVPRATPIIGYVRGDVADVRLTSAPPIGAVDVLKAQLIRLQEYRAQAANLKAFVGAGIDAVDHLLEADATQISQLIAQLEGKDTQS